MSEQDAQSLTAQHRAVEHDLPAFDLELAVAASDEVIPAARP